MVPTIHYQMGGIPTNIYGQVVAPNNGNPSAIVKGLYAVGECACVSVHGANRLGTNSLLDIVVFGRAAGKHIVEFNKENEVHKSMPENGADISLERLNRLNTATTGEYAQVVAGDMRDIMQQHASVFRTQASMDDGVAKIAQLRQRVNNIKLTDKSQIFNTERIEALEVENMIEVAQSTMVSAAARHECRGAHSVADYDRPADDANCPLGRDDVNWLKHTMWDKASNSLSYKPVNLKPLTVDSIPPKIRTF